MTTITFWSFFGAFEQRQRICDKYEESRSLGREWEQPVPGLLPVQQLTPSQLHVEAMIELVTAQLADLVNA